MTLRLCYELPETAPQWQIQLVKSAPVQFVLQNRMTAGMTRFAKVMRREWQELEAREGHGTLVVE